MFNNITFTLQILVCYSLETAEIVVNISTNFYTCSVVFNSQAHILCVPDI
jgi:hypothetical protein